ncbi:hypothetical protein [Sphingomonas bisphenolicum]|uniref:Uncharacterized protein n=1 Tax=Sphingomonas bisphenolicum TaxID=296544 RepID=A0ABM7G7E3_9SPHN|nr:hypothetical protein [Sphingomonas bisphenolicum]BBF70981.1 hypothetical protein SBA_ch1_31810 [Sphingomonas bisphenolicum]
MSTYSCDRGQAEAVKGKSVAHPGWTIAATMLASSLAFIDGSVTNVALPAIGKELGGMHPACLGSLTAICCRCPLFCFSVGLPAIISGASAR